MQLNEPQREAALHTSGPLLVFAGAGSGKTRVITYRVANLLANHRVPPYRILCVTFTNKAAGEMRERLEKLAGPEVVRDLWVGTFHSVCCRLLRRYHDEVGLERHFVIYDDSDQKAVVARLIKDRGLDDRLYPPKRVLARIHGKKQEGVRPREVKEDNIFDAVHVELFEAYEGALKRANAVDFDDLILHVMRIAEDTTSAAGRELRERFDYLLVDEFQDTNGVQYRLIRALAAHSQNLCVVGDDDQSIYSWRGADIRNIRGFQRDFPSAAVVKLEQNYRSSANIVAAALGVIEQSESREPKALWTEQPAGEDIVVRACRDERDEARYVAETVASEVISGTAANEIAIFYRVNAQSRVLEEALRALAVPYQIVGGMRFFDRAEVKDVMAYLRLVQNPRSDADLVRVINVPARGIGQKSVQRLLDFATQRGTSAYDALRPALHEGALGAAAKKRVLAFVELVDELRRLSSELGPSALASEIVERTDYRKALRDADTAEADARLENIEELLGSIKEYEADCEAHELPISLDGYLERVALVADIDQVETGPSVLMMTVHSAKGLEFDRVFLTGLEEEIFPYRGVDGEAPDELEEERRLAYVAITRARKRLTITYAGMRLIFGQTRYGAPSRFLANLPEDTISHTGGAFGGGHLRFGSRDWDSPRHSQPSRSAPSRFVPGRGYVHGAPPAAEASRARSLSPAKPPEGERHIDYEAYDDIPQAQQVKGKRVFHQRFGRGIVQRVEPGIPPQVVARFPGFGERKVLASYLRFE